MLLPNLAKALAAFTLLVSSVTASSCQIEAAQAYVKAIASHSTEDAAKVPLEDDVVRFE